MPLPTTLDEWRRHFGEMRVYICGPDATYRMLLIGVDERAGRWILVGYDEGRLNEPLELDAADVTEMRPDDEAEAT